LWLGLFSLLLASCQYAPTTKHSDSYFERVDELYALWNFYKYTYIQDGRVVSLDEGGVSTSEGQGYAMLRAVWADDPATFERTWRWTRENLQKRDDKLFAWKWKDGILDSHSATDADTDIALALILASRRFSRPTYQQEALSILDSLWKHEVLHIGTRCFIVSGDWSLAEEYPTIHVAYLAPYAYQVFASEDKGHPWDLLTESSYDILHWIYFQQKWSLPPEILFIDKRIGQLYSVNPQTGQSSSFSYDAFPIFWRVAIDADWFPVREGRLHHQWTKFLYPDERAAFGPEDLWSKEAKLRRQMLSFFKTEWKEKGKFLDHYDTTGKPLSDQEGLALYATVHSLALAEDPSLARDLWEKKVSPLWRDALTTKQQTTYYLHNWLWFDRAFELRQARRLDEFLSFLRPFDFVGFQANFPWRAFLAMVGLFLLTSYGRLFRLAFLVTAIALCLRYLTWRFLYTLNFIEPAGPFISVSLWLTECYCFATVLLVFVQVGLGRKEKRVAPRPTNFFPSVDILIPIYSEPLEILEKTLIAASAIVYPHKKIYVCDDSHNPQVTELAGRYGAGYIKGPKKHAKAGNLNNAMGQTSGELVVVFDTDHIPATSFLEETVPYFVDPKIGFIQTPHHFYNEDIFQRAFRLGPEVPNEQDMFHHAIQGARDSWGGSFFVGSGAVFRRRALESVGGFKLMSITEDIHTSQYLHAAGWQCVFVNKDLAVGLNAENLSSYLTQRRRWMLGALQIFFKDNPLFRRGLGLRHRLGYVAAIWYFFFPVARIMIWLSPMYYLLFHWHPIFTEVSILVAYLLPYMVALPLMSAVLLPGWPRLLWGELYEAVVAVPLLRSMLDLFLPKNLGFKVTPKGIVSNQRRFDWGSAWMTVVVTGITAAAILKGFAEFFYFGIEKDAYFFNLGWAIGILLVLLAALLIAWERPQRRANDRLRVSIPFRIKAGSVVLEGRTRDLSLTGFSFIAHERTEFSSRGILELKTERPVTCSVQLVYHEEVAPRRFRCGLAFSSLAPEAYRELVTQIFASAKTWEHAHESRLRNNGSMVLALLKGMMNYFRPLKNRRRRMFRRPLGQWAHLRVDGQRRSIFVRNRSAEGLGIYYIGRQPAVNDSGILTNLQRVSSKVRVVHVRRIAPGVGLAGLTVVSDRLALDRLEKPAVKWEIPDEAGRLVSE